MEEILTITIGTVMVLAFLKYITGQSEAGKAKEWRRKSLHDLGIPPGFTNSIGMKFIAIPSGEFMMGSQFHKGSIHPVRIGQPFYLGKYPVTQEEWYKIMEDNPSRHKGRRLPVTNVSWNDVQQFVQKLNQKEQHNRYRLPTEAEWEYACRAGRKQKIFQFDNDDPFREKTDERERAIEREKTHEKLMYAAEIGVRSVNRYHDEYTHYVVDVVDYSEVGRKRANPWGLYDMISAVWEWCAYLTGSEKGDSSNRVARGGPLWRDYLGPSSRITQNPNVRDHTPYCRDSLDRPLFDRCLVRNEILFGFRLACSIK